jgi:hypothetical protein
MLEDALAGRVPKVVQSLLWRRGVDLLDPLVLTTVRVAVGEGASILSQATVAAWVRDNGDVWLLNPSLDSFVIAVDAPPRGRPSPLAANSLRLIVDALRNEFDVRLDSKASVSLTVRKAEGGGGEASVEQRAGVVDDGGGGGVDGAG